ncbi:ATP-binding protein [Desulfobacula sp.]
MKQTILNKDFSEKINDSSGVSNIILNVPPIIDISLEAEGQYMVVSIADNGIGIEPEYHDKIFKKVQNKLEVKSL